MENIYTFLASADQSSVGKENIKENFDAIANQIQYYIHIILGSFAGVLTLAIIITAAFAFYKAGKSESEDERQNQLKRIKWLVIFLAAVVILWAISSTITQIIKAALGA